MMSKKLEFDSRYVRSRGPIRCEDCDTPWVTLVDSVELLEIGCPKCSKVELSVPALTITPKQST